MTDHVEGLFDALRDALEEEETAQTLLREVLDTEHSGVPGTDSGPTGEDAPAETSPRLDQEGGGTSPLLRTGREETHYRSPSQAQAVQEPVAPDRRAEVLLDQARLAERMLRQVPALSQSAVGARWDPGPAGLSAPAGVDGYGAASTRPVHLPGLDPREVDRAFQRDSRRYDNGFTLY